MKFFKQVGNQSGQGMTEYIIIVALIAIAAIAAFTYFGSTVRDQTTSMTQELAGQASTTQGNLSAVAGKAGDDAKTPKGLSSYADGEKAAK